jgi:hypothetical protein
MEIVTVYCIVCVTASTHTMASYGSNNSTKHIQFFLSTCIHAAGQIAETSECVGKASVSIHRKHSDKVLLFLCRGGTATQSRVGSASRRSDSISEYRNPSSELPLCPDCEHIHLTSRPGFHKLSLPVHSKTISGSVASDSAGDLFASMLPVYISMLELELFVQQKLASLAIVCRFSHSHA